VWNAACARMQILSPFPHHHMRQMQPPDGSLLFSYVHTDEFCERAETAKAITTSSSEGSNHLVRRLLRNPRNRQKVCGVLSWLSFPRLLGSIHHTYYHPTFTTPTADAQLPSDVPDGRSNRRLINSSRLRHPPLRKGAGGCACTPRRQL